MWTATQNKCEVKKSSVYASLINLEKNLRAKSFLVAEMRLSLSETSKHLEGDKVFYGLNVVIQQEAKVRTLCIAGETFKLIHTVCIVLPIMLLSANIIMVLQLVNIVA